MLSFQQSEPYAYLENTFKFQNYISLAYDNGVPMVSLKKLGRLLFSPTV